MKLNVEELLQTKAYDFLSKVDNDSNTFGMIGYKAINTITENTLDSFNAKDFFICIPPICIICYNYILFIGKMGIFFIKY